MDCKNSILEVPFAPTTINPQLQALLTETVRPLVDRINAQDDRIAWLEDRLAALEATSAPPAEIPAGEVHLPQQATSPPDIAIIEEIIQLRSDMEMFNESRALEIAQDRQRIAALEVVRPQPKQRNQGDILRALLATTPNGKMLQSTARQKMGISKSAFSRLLRTLDGTVKHEPYHRDRRQNVLILINKKS